MGISSHHAIVEKGPRIFRHPKYLTRLSAALLIRENSGDSNSTPTPASSSSATEPNVSSKSNENAFAARPNTRNEVDGDLHYRLKFDIEAEGGSFCWNIIYSPMKDSSFWEATLVMGDQAECDEVGHKDDEIVSGVDMNRITPEYFLHCPSARLAVKKELLGMVNISRGKAAFRLTSGRDERWKGCKRAHSMIIMKRKSAREYKARLLLMGDTISEQDVAFSSAPTASRGSIKCALTMDALYGLTLSVSDASQAFSQSDDLCLNDKCSTDVAPFVILPDIASLGNARLQECQ